LGNTRLCANWGAGRWGSSTWPGNRHLRRHVALKMILRGHHAGTVQRHRFVTEARAVGRLNHPNIVQIHEVGEHQGLPYFTLEYCEGGSLAGRVARDPLPWREAATLVETVARGMHAAHRAGIVHRDLKPENILLTADGTPKIGDFGTRPAGGRRLGVDRRRSGPGHARLHGPGAGARWVRTSWDRPPTSGRWGPSSTSC